MLIVAGGVSKTMLAVLQVPKILFAVAQHGVIEELLLVEA
jgi:hypothetical protein